MTSPASIADPTPFELGNGNQTTNWAECIAFYERLIPVYNVDGCVNRQSSSRANQLGPESFGFRGNGRTLPGQRLAAFNVTLVDARRKGRAQYRLATVLQAGPGDAIGFPAELVWPVTGSVGAI